MVCAGLFTAPQAQPDLRNSIGSATLIPHRRDTRFFRTSWIHGGRESSMERIFILATIIWLGGFGMPHAQTNPGLTPAATPGAIPGTTAGATPGVATPGPTGSAATSGARVQLRPPCFISSISTSISTGGAATAAPCNSDPLTLPTATLPSAGAATGAAGGSTSGLGAFSSIGSVSSSIGPVSSPISAQTQNPQRALQLPGEALNTPTQAPVTTTQDQGATASHTGVSSNALCSAVMPSTTGAASAENLVGGVSLSGC
jgi:hypothetical protein